MVLKEINTDELNYPHSAGRYVSAYPQYEKCDATAEEECI